MPRPPTTEHCSLGLNAPGVTADEQVAGLQLEIARADVHGGEKHPPPSRAARTALRAGRPCQYYTPPTPPDPSPQAVRLKVPWCEHHAGNLLERVCRAVWGGWLGLDDLPDGATTGRRSARRRSLRGAFKPIEQCTVRSGARAGAAPAAQPADHHAGLWSGRAGRSLASDPGIPDRAMDGARPSHSPAGASRPRPRWQLPRPIVATVSWGGAQHQGRGCP